MVVFSCRYIIPFLVLRGYSIPNLAFCVQFESSKHQWKRESVTHKWMPYAIRSFLYLPYMSKGGNEPLHQQLTHILAVYQSLFHAERVTPNLAFLSNLIVAISRNDAMRIIRGSKMIPEVPQLPYTSKEGYRRL